MNRGQSLFEVVVALAISALIIGGIVSLVTNAIRNSTYSKNQSLAAGFAQQATEWLRGKRDLNVMDFTNKTNTSPTWCLSDLPADLADVKAEGCSEDDKILGTNFIREVKFTSTSVAPSGPGTAVNLIEADVAVRWTDAQGTHKVTSATSFSDWRQR